MKHLFKLFLLTIFITNSVKTFAQKDTLRVLFVGNSYTYYSEMPKIVSVLSKSTSTYIETVMSTAGGLRLKYHFNQERGLKTKELIKNGNFDIVVLQEQSMGTITSKKEFFEYAKKLSEYIKKHNAKPYFFVTWARKNTPGIQKIITKAYKKAAKENNGVAVLVGEAWKKAKKRQRTLNLFDPDGSHPNAIGSFLSACVFVKTITGEVPKKCEAYNY